MKSRVIGCGYLGAVHGPLIASFSRNVVGGDMDDAKIGERLEGEGADLCRVDATVEALTLHLHPDDEAARKSTVPAGTAQQLTTTSPTGARMVGNPAFPREGFAAEEKLATEWVGVPALDPTGSAACVARQVLIDGRNTLNPASWREAGWTYHGLGR
ncbi:hypothetical protein BHE97_17475 [Aeromicrobium sp. PE09-221]|uniref:hypothetical protein n=1 Tax=Aeromicrobium sp. PE09-221 TaxID=1898043 RepID=UPI000B3E986C|nr:hypothetical protein [Aeromicrobium sp. PE09-221]OUZ07291.1 hypothetical protein BHE97_17475 [Aeromicrobium sp. PE09-221]